MWLNSGSFHAGSWTALPVRRRRLPRSARLPPALEHFDDDHASAAVLADLDMPAKRRVTAVLDGRHDLELGEAQVSRIGGPIGRPGRTEDVGDLD